MSDKQRDREERQHVIKVLQNMVDWMEAANYIVATPERRHALDYAINSIKTDLKYDLMYEGALEQEPRWIPVSEKLPKLITHKTSLGMVKKSELVYITYQQNGKNQYCPIPCYYHSNGNWYTDRKSVEEWANLDEYDDLMDDALCCEVIAWMPLPKTYEPQESEDNNAEIN